VGGVREVFGDRLETQDRKVSKASTSLLAGMVRNGNEGIGKLQRLMHDFTRYWSRRITDDHRGFRGLVLGSVSQHVAGYAKCSVTIVR
jgi:Txe/YoeB family toxin of Txe-Axe toxin-antitoxin module